MNNLNLGLQGIRYGACNSGYPAHVDALYRHRAMAQQAMSRLLRFQQQGMTVTPSGSNVAECLAVVAAKVAALESECERAAAEL